MLAKDGGGHTEPIDGKWWMSSNQLHQLLSCPAGGPRGAHGGLQLGHGLVKFNDFFGCHFIN
jgi:hypothetical protein